MFRGVSAFLLFLSAAIPTVSAFGAPTVLPTAKHDAATKACSSGFRSSPALRIAPAGGALLRKNLGGARAAMASDSVDVASLNSLVDAAQPSDTIVLEKVHTLPGVPTLVPGPRAQLCLLDRCASDHMLIAHPFNRLPSNQSSL
jgi:hypothetical protein